MNDEIWNAIVECDARYDGKLFYGLHTTKIYCKPSCKSKTPKRENVSIFRCTQDAERFGLRPCKRCRPDESTWTSTDVELTQKLLELINTAYGEPLTLNEMAAKLFISPFYLQKSFKRVMNLTPAKYLTNRRMEEAKRLLLEGSLNITEIAIEVGFRNSAHFSVVFHKETGYKPSEFRQMRISH